MVYTSFSFTPNYLLGVEEKEEDAFDMEMKILLRRITDDRVKAILVAQIKAVAYI
jgi:hypothetical protein